MQRCVDLELNEALRWPHGKNEERSDYRAQLSGYRQAHNAGYVK